MAKRKKPAFPRLIQRQMAAFLGLKPATMEWATNEKIVPRDPDGLYRPEVVTGQWLAYERSRNAKREKKTELERARVRLTEAKAAAAERKLAMLDRGLVGTADIVELVRTVALRIRNKMTAAIPRISRASYAAGDPKEATLAVRREFDVLLGELAALKPDKRRGNFEVVLHDEGKSAA